MVQAIVRDGAALHTRRPLPQGRFLMGHRTRVLATLTVFLLAAVPALAQSKSDHLTCYKLKDPLKVKGTLDVDAGSLGVAKGCKISKAQLYCVPADAQNVALPGATTVPVDGPRAAGGRICYKVACPKATVAPQDVSDAFGTRTLDKLKTSMVCAPAGQGAPVNVDGLDHYPRGLARIAAGGGAVGGSSVHVVSTDGLPPATTDGSKSAVGEGGGGGVVVVLQAVSGYSVRVRDERDSASDLDVAALRPGAVLNVRGHSTENSESMFDAMSVGAGSGGVSSTAYFPRLQRSQPNLLRTATVTCAGAPAGAATEAVAGDPNWTWFSQVWPDSYETSSGATTDDVTFVWENGCVDLREPGSGAVVSGDRLVISADNGSNPRQLKRAMITGGGGLAAFAVKGETTH